MKFDCRSCENSIDIRTALAEAEFSFPELNAVYHVCGQCQSGMHFRFDKGSIQLIEITGAPGPHWSVTEEVKYSGVSVRSDPNMLHVWLDGNHYETLARGA